MLVGSVAVADFIPTVTRNNNGFLTLDWPTNQRGETMVAREVMVQMVDDLNRLRTAGDALVAVMQAGSDTGWDAAIDAWKEARRG